MTLFLHLRFRNWYGRHLATVPPSVQMTLCPFAGMVVAFISVVRELVFSTLAGVVGKIHSSQINILVAGIVYLHPVAVIAESVSIAPCWGGSADASFRTRGTRLASWTKTALSVKPSDIVSYRILGCCGWTVPGPRQFKTCLPSGNWKFLCTD